MRAIDDSWRLAYKCFRMYPFKITGYFVSTVAIFVLWLLSPIVKIKVAELVTPRIGHMALIFSS